MLFIGLEVSSMSVVLLVYGRSSHTMYMYIHDIVVDVRDPIFSVRNMTTQYWEIVVLAYCGLTCFFSHQQYPHTFIFSWEAFDYIRITLSRNLTAMRLFLTSPWSLKTTPLWWTVNLFHDNFLHLPRDTWLYYYNIQALRQKYCARTGKKLLEWVSRSHI